MKAVDLGSIAYVQDDASDEELARAAQTGRQCFLLLYERHVGRVQRYVFSQVAHAGEVEDLVSTVFFRALTKIDTYQPDRGSFSAWLFGIARNAIHDHRRLTFGRRLLPLEAAGDMQETRPGPEDLAVLRERHDAIQRAFDRCTPEQRDALALRYLAELSFADVAGALGKSEPAAKMPLVKALGQFGTFAGVKAVERGCSTGHGGVMNGQQQCSSPTFDLSRARFASKYLSFVSKDLTRTVNGDPHRFQSLNGVETALYNQYVRFRGQPQCFKIPSPGHVVNYPCSKYEDYVTAAINSTNLRTLPLITIGGYLQTASQDLSAADMTRSIAVTPLPRAVSSIGINQGLPFDAVRQALSTAHDPPGVNTLVEHVNAEANIITALICHADGKRPASVCSRSAIKAILKHVK